jgi:hypothetical protein
VLFTRRVRLADFFVRAQVCACPEYANRSEKSKQSAHSSAVEHYTRSFRPTHFIWVNCREHSQASKKSSRGSRRHELARVLLRVDLADSVLIIARGWVLEVIWHTGSQHFWPKNSSWRLQTSSIYAWSWQQNKIPLRLRIARGKLCFVDKENSS